MLQILQISGVFFGSAGMSLAVMSLILNLSDCKKMLQRKRKGNKETIDNRTKIIEKEWKDTIWITSIEE